MDLLHEEKVGCPYCGELIDVLLDPGDTDQEYIEDCQVCCRPITFAITTNYAGDLVVQLHGENEI